MKDRVLAICDTESVYAQRLAEYLGRKQVNPFRTRAFSSLEELADYAGSEAVEVLLISPELAAEDLSGLRIGKRIMLTGGQIPGELEGMPAVYKYQSAEKIIREILCCYAEDAPPFLQAALVKGRAQLYGVYSPVHRIGKTTFALALGTVCARKRRTLYVNLEAYSGFAQRMRLAAEWNLGDLLYFLKREKQGFLYKLKSVTESLGGLDFISPVLSPEDLLTVEEEEWEALLERLITDADYECLVVDFSDCVQGLPALLGKCGQIYMPVREDAASLAKLAQFEKLLELQGGGELLEAIHRIRLPRARVAENGNGSEELPAALLDLAEELLGGQDEFR